MGTESAPRLSHDPQIQLLYATTFCRLSDETLNDPALSSAGDEWSRTNIADSHAGDVAAAIRYLAVHDPHRKPTAADDRRPPRQLLRSLVSSHHRIATTTSVDIAQERRDIHAEVARMLNHADPRFWRSSAALDLPNSVMRDRIVIELDHQIDAAAHSAVRAHLVVAQRLMKA